MPVSSVGLTSAYGGDIHVIPASRHDSVVRPVGDYRSNVVPISTTTYAVRKDPVHRTSSLRESSQTRTRRSSTLDSSRRPPVIVTTTRHGGSSHADGPDSPPRGDTRRDVDEGAYYAQPASSMHGARGASRGAVPYSAQMDNEEYQRLKERTGEDRLHSRHADPYRSRGSMYSGSSHRNPPIDYGPDSYEYTNPGDLVRHDLDNNRPRHKRRESYDQYYRPSVSVTTDINKPYDLTERRSRGPPPTSRQLDKLNRNAAAGIYDAPSVRMPVPPVVPLAPEPARQPHLGVPLGPSADRRSSSRSRPVSMIMDGRYAHPDDYYHGRQDELIHREMRDHERDYIQDDSVTSRGFGLRLDPKELEETRRGSEARHRDERRERREVRKENEEREPRRASDEDLDSAKRKEPRRDHEDRDRKGTAARVSSDEDDRHDVHTKHSAAPEEEDGGKKDKVRDKVAAGLSIAAASIGLAGVMKKKDKEDADVKDDASPPRRRKEEDADRRRSDDVEPRYRVYKKDGARKTHRDELEVVEEPRDRDRPPRRKAPLPEEEPESRDRDRQANTVTEPSDDHSLGPAAVPEPVPERQASNSPPSTDEAKPKSRFFRRRRASSAFNPNDTAGLMALKAQLASAESHEKATADHVPAIKEPSPERPDRRAPVDGEPDAGAETALVFVPEDQRGRDLAPPEKDARQVRLVSPPREKDEKKPIRGILKQPKVQFPEEVNPVREGVAPHKDDKKNATVPAGARWTKINRRLVNPEALTIGKERFEVRDEFVIVLRVLSKEEIEAYTAATAQLRGGLQHFSYLLTRLRFPSTPP